MSQPVITMPRIDRSTITADPDIKIYEICDFVARGSECGTVCETCALFSTGNFNTFVDQYNELKGDN